jgi:hypothetical protein
METGVRLRIAAVACALLAGATAAAPGRIIYVDDDATGTNDGSSWANAFPWLRVALAAAGEGDEIRVGQGTYKPYQGADTQANRRIYVTFFVGNGVVLRGGYAGVGAPDPNARNVEVYRTILSGDLNDDDPNVQGTRESWIAPGRADNSLCVVTIEQVDWCVLDGFLIRGGGRGDGQGGGLSVQDSSPTVWNCAFTHNLGLNGGAVYITCGSGGAPRRAEFHNCKFNTNAVLKGGGALYIQRGELLLTGCEFVGNTATSWGGGVYSYAADVMLSGCVFRANWAGEGGGLFHDEGNLHLTNCVFLENASVLAEMNPYTGTASGAGGAALVNVSSMGREAVVTDCLFRRNEALHGGAIEGTLKAVRGCRFTGNVASYGGAIDNQGSLICENCLFEGNRATAHAAALRNYDQLQLTNCTFSDNRSPDGEVFHATGGHGGPVHITLTNCIVWGKPHGLDPQQSWLSLAFVTCSDIEGGYPGFGNIDADPLFADPGRWDPNGTPDDLSDDVWVEGDCHLKSRAGRWDSAAGAWVQDEVSSPCIDAGARGEAVGEEPLPNGGRVNMSAYGGTAEASKSYRNEP